MNPALSIQAFLILLCRRFYLCCSTVGYKTSTAGCRKDWPACLPLAAAHSCRQFADFNVLVPRVVAVILKADVTTAGKVFENPVELGIGSVRPFVGLVPLIEVHPGDKRPVDDHHDQVFVACQLKVIPLADWFQRVFSRPHQVVDGPHVVVACAGAFLDGDFHPVPANVTNIRQWCHGKDAKENSTVAFLRQFEIKREDEIFILLFGRNHVGAAIARIEAALFGRRPDGGAVAGDPAAGVLAVEQEFPASGFFGLCKLVFLGNRLGCHHDGEHSINNAW